MRTKRNYAFEANYRRHFPRRNFAALRLARIVIKRRRAGVRAQWLPHSNPFRELNRPRLPSLRAQLSGQRARNYFKMVYRGPRAIAFHVRYVTGPQPVRTLAAQAA